PSHARRRSLLLHWRQARRSLRLGCCAAGRGNLSRKGFGRGHRGRRARGCGLHCGRGRRLGGGGDGGPPRASARRGPRKVRRVHRDGGARARGLEPRVATARDAGAGGGRGGAVDRRYERCGCGGAGRSVARRRGAAGVGARGCRKRRLPRGRRGGCCGRGRLVPARPARGPVRRGGGGGVRLPLRRGARCCAGGGGAASRAPATVTRRGRSSDWARGSSRRVCAGVGWSAPWRVCGGLCVLCCCQCRPAGQRV
ncbi:hypothetical protein EMIHUDRAFT_468556, partial [Emiliania huxleyi CCMP1516]